MISASADSEDEYKMVKRENDLDIARKLNELEDLQFRNDEKIEKLINGASSESETNEILVLLNRLSDLSGTLKINPCLSEAAKDGVREYMDGVSKTFDAINRAMTKADREKYVNKLIGASDSIMGSYKTLKQLESYAKK